MNLAIRLLAAALLLLVLIAVTCHRQAAAGERAPKIFAKGLDLPIMGSSTMRPC